MAKKCFNVQKNTILGWDRRFFDFVLSHSPTFHPLQNDRWNRFGNLSCSQTKTLVEDEMYADVVNVCHRFVVPLGTRRADWRRSQSCDCVLLEKWNERSTRPVGSTSINGLTICAIIAITSLFWNYVQSRRKGSDDLIFLKLDGLWQRF